MPLVVLTYPGHFLLTALTIKSYLEYHTPTEVVVVVDTINKQTWPTYIKDCEELYNCRIINANKINSIELFSEVGWIRQQIIKLYLDQIIDFDSWFFTDGDIIFLNKVQLDETPYSVPYFSQTTQMQNDYVKFMLDIDVVGIQKNQQQVCVSNPAFRTMHKEILQSLREYVAKIHQRDLINLHLRYQTSNSVAVSEWELIENFQQNIQKKNLNLVKYAPHRLGDTSADLNYFEHQFLTCYGTDQDLGRDFFDFPISDDIWQILSNIHR